ncbi:MAG: hypothetical protein M9962_11880 [Oligoflexia bacterium]|nr:hypothetical protein [Oligoflexia bacterium]
MTNFSRRNFFKILGESVLDHTSIPKIKSKVESKENVDFTLGHISEYQPGSEKIFFRTDGTLRIYSLDEGLKAEWKTDGAVNFVTLFIKKNGELAVNLKRECSRTSVFSLMTGEMTEVE